MFSADTVPRTLLSEMRRPARFIFALPSLHRLGIVADLAVHRVQLQRSAHFPSDVGKLKHRDGNVANSNGSIQLFSLAYARDEVREMRIGHGVVPDKIGRRGSL